MPPASEHKRVKSIARRIGRSWTSRLVFVFLVLDIAVAILFGGALISTFEREVSGSFVPKAARGVEVNVEAGDPERIADSAMYWFYDANGVRHTFALKPYLAALLGAFGGLLVLELIMLVFMGGAGKRTANRALKPIMQISKTAEKLSTAKFDGARIENLEHAIKSISPALGGRVKTADKELTGLASAVNNLLTRMTESNRERMRFVSDASHELRTPIAVIQGYSNMLSRWGKTDDKILDESIAAISTEAEHMSKLVEQLLFLARGDDGRTELSIERFSLTETLRDVYEEYQMIDHKHSYSFFSTGDVPCVADQAMIKQVARVLTDNAIKYTPDGGNITLRVLSRPDAPRFQVQDNGIGIEEADLPRIFERFFRSDPARGRATGGTGLGLSIAKWIVDRHGGHFEVLSRKDIGTRITVVLPIPRQEIEI